jgi:hypothetical protein
MVRKEIIHKAGSIVDGMVSNYVPSEICDSYYQGFLEGATLAEEIMIKKVCKWLEDYAELTGIDSEIIKESFKQAIKE